MVSGFESPVGLPQMIIEIMRRRGVTIFAAVVVCLGLAVAYFMVATVIYESQAIILVERKDSTLPSEGTDKGGRFDSEISEEMLATHMEVIRSRRVVERALETNDLAKLPSVLAALKTDQDATSYVIDNLTISKGGEGEALDAHTLQVSFRHTSADDCTAILNAVVASYQAFIEETFRDVGGEAVELIAKAKGELAEELQRSEQEYQEFLEKSPIVGSGDTTENVHQTRWSTMETTLSEVRQKLTQTKSRIASIETAMQSQHVVRYSDLERLSFLDDADVQRLSLLVSVEKETGSEEFESEQPTRVQVAKAEQDTLQQLKRDEVALLLNYGEEHPDVLKARSQIKEMERFLVDVSSRIEESKDSSTVDPKELLKAYIEMLRNDVAHLERQKKDLEESSAEELRLSKQLVGFELQGSLMRDRLDRKRELYEAVVDRLSDVNLVKDYGGYLGVSEVISLPRKGEVVHPELSILLAVAGFAGLMLGFGGAMVLDITDPSFRNPAHVVQALHQPIWAHVPKIRKPRRGAKATGSDVSIAPSITTYHQQQPGEVEAFRRLRTSLYLNANGHPRKTIQVTSGSQSEGNSTTVANLAVSVAQTGKRVLLLDANLRFPKIHELFGLDNGTGFSSVIAGEATSADAIQSTAVENLDVLPAGPPTAQPAELLQSLPFKEFLQEVAEGYDLVLIDSAPVLTASESAWTAAQVDGVLLVVRVRKRDQPAVNRAKDLLARSSAELVGVVVNGMNGLKLKRFGLYGYTGYEQGEVEIA